MRNAVTRRRVLHRAALSAAAIGSHPSATRGDDMRPFLPNMTELIPAFGGGFGINDPDLSPTRTPVVYSQTAPDPAWIISQWGSVQGRLAPFRPTRISGRYIAESPVASVFAGPHQIALKQSGRLLSCDDAGQPHEFDLLFAPNRLEQFQVPLGAVRRIIQSVELEASWTLVDKVIRCGVTQVGTLTAAVLSNPAAKQTLFHQIHFHIARVAEGELRTIRPHGLAWFFRENPFGVDDFLGDGTSPNVSLTFDLLPRLREAIATAPSGLDHRFENWSLTSVYAGQHIWGGVDARSAWHKFSMMAG